MIEAAIAAGAEAIVIDMQHGLFDRTSLEAAIAAVPPRVPCLVRVEDDSAAAIGRALDAGAEGVIVPLVETGKQARARCRGVPLPAEPATAPAAGSGRCARRATWQPQPTPSPSG